MRVKSELRLLAAASHQFSQPLTALRGSLELALLWNKEPEESVEVLQEALEQTDRLIQWTRAIADLSEEDTLPQAAEKISLASLLEELVEAARPCAEARQMNFLIEIAEELYVTASPRRISRAILNIIDNAVRYSTSGSTIHVTLQPQGTRACVSIQDEGPGFSQDEMAHIFEPFYRGREAVQASEGAGLGLAIARRIVLACGGAIEVENCAPGACVRILLPVTDSSQHEASQLNEDSMKSQSLKIPTKTRPRRLAKAASGSKIAVTRQDRTR